MCDLCGETTFCQLNVCSDCKSSIDNMEQNFNSLQQLKAEIAAVANTIIECEAGGVTVDFAALKRHLLRLSAV